MSSIIMIVVTIRVAPMYMDLRRDIVPSRDGFSVNFFSVFYQ